MLLQKTLQTYKNQINRKYLFYFFSQVSVSSGIECLIEMKWQVRETSELRNCGGLGERQESQGSKHSPSIWEENYIKPVVPKLNGVMVLPQLLLPGSAGHHYLRSCRTVPESRWQLPCFARSCTIQDGYAKISRDLEWSKMGTFKSCKI